MSVTEDPQAVEEERYREPTPVPDPGCELSGSLETWRKGRMQKSPLRDLCTGCGQCLGSTRRPQTTRIAETPFLRAAVHLGKDYEGPLGFGDTLKLDSPPAEILQEGVTVLLQETTKPELPKYVGIILILLLLLLPILPFVLLLLLVFLLLLTLLLSIISSLLHLPSLVPRYSLPEQPSTPAALSGSRCLGSRWTAAGAGSRPLASCPTRRRARGWSAGRPCGSSRPRPLSPDRWSRRRRLLWTSLFTPTT